MFLYSVVRSICTVSLSLSHGQISPSLFLSWATPLYDISTLIASHNWVESESKPSKNLPTGALWRYGGGCALVGRTCDNDGHPARVSELACFVVLFVHSMCVFPVYILLER